MILSHLSLTHYRNYSHLELDFDGGLTLLQGENAQGKTNLLEAIYFLATSKSSHTRTGKEVVAWDAASEPIPYCQITGVVASDGPIVAAKATASRWGEPQSALDYSPAGSRTRLSIPGHRLQM